MKTFLALSAMAALTLSLSAQVSDPQQPGKQNDLNNARAASGKLGKRDQFGTFKEKDGILKARDAVMFMKAGKLTHVNQEMKLSEGFVVKPNGQVTKPDGTTITLQEGQMLTLDGRMIQAPAETGTTVPGNQERLPERKGPLTDFGNSAGQQPQTTRNKAGQ